jgi:hypothetical protein
MATPSTTAAPQASAQAVTQNPTIDNQLQQPSQQPVGTSEAPIPAASSKTLQPIPSQQSPQGGAGVVSQLDSLLAAVKGLRADILARKQQDDAGSS